MDEGASAYGKKFLGYLSGKQDYFVCSCIKQFLLFRAEEKQPFLLMRSGAVRATDEWLIHPRGGWISHHQ